MRLLKNILYLILPVSLLAVPAAGYAERVTNEFGLYTDLSADPASASIDIEPNTLFTVYLMVTNPYNFNYTPYEGAVPYERAMDGVLGFACQIHFPESGFLLAQYQTNGLAGRIGNSPEYYFAFDESVPVPENRQVLLMTLTMVVLDTEPKAIYLAPSNGANVGDRMAILDEAWSWLGGNETAYPSSGSFDLPVFGINRTVVSVDTESWDGVKALYR